MKDSFLEMLINLFEQTLSNIQKDTKHNNLSDEASSLDFVDDVSEDSEALEAEVIQSANAQSFRVFTAHERLKLTKASYQFLMRMLVWEVIDSDTLEQIINQLIFSESRIVALEETKWVVRNVLEDLLDDAQLDFLDLVLYQKEERYTVH